MKETVTDRNYGIDLLRLLAMAYVIILHTLGHGGVLHAAEVGSHQYNCAWLMEIAAFGAVNIFALISGFTINTQKPKRSFFGQLLYIWLEVLYYGLIITVIINIKFPGTVTLNDFYTALFPICKGEYWYFTAYAGAMLLMPAISVVVENSPVPVLKKMLIVIIIAFSVVDIIIKKWMVSGGYSFVWIALLFLTGAIIRKCEIGFHIKKRFLIIGIIVFCLIPWLCQCFGIEKKYIIGIEITNNVFVSYTSPFVLGAAILYLLLFFRLKVNNVLKKGIAFLSPGAFAAYLINDNRLFRGHFITDRFVRLGLQKVIILIITVLIFAFLFVIASALFDKVRQKLFALLKLKQFSNWAVQKINAGLK